MNSVDLLGLLNNQPIGFIDVGARDWVHPLIDPVPKAIAVLGFEPDRAECARMQADPSLKERYADVHIEPIALADKDGPAVLYEIIAPTNSSLRRPNPVFVERYDMVKWHEVGQFPLQTTTLDNILFGQRAGEVHWGEALKIDTQGTEFEILQGALRTLEERTSFVCLEVSFCELYSGQAQFSEIELLMREAGLSFYGFDAGFTRSRRSLDKRTHWGRERMFQADAYFFRDPFDPQNVGKPSSERSRAVTAAFAILSGYHDFALELLATLGEAGKTLSETVIRDAALPAEGSRAAAEALAQAVIARPDDANVLVGKFVDQRRAKNDYFDVILK